jgi:MraZ protein
MKHAAFFIGEHELTIDEKNRMLVPSDVRGLMNPERDGDGFYVLIGSNRKPWLYAERYYDQLLAREAENLTTEAELNPDKNRLDDWHRRFGMASKVNWDKQGRILLPDATLRRTGTGREITLVGVRNHLELWNRQDWEVRFNELLNPAAADGQ